MKILKTVSIQGDLRIVKIDKIPKTAKKRDDKVLVYGESTGHAHRITDGNVYDYKDMVLMTVPTNTTIIHEDHGDIPLEEKGDYGIIRQREYVKDNMTKIVVD